MVSGEGMGCIGPDEMKCVMNKRLTAQAKPCMAKQEMAWKDLNEGEIAPREYNATKW